MLVQNFVHILVHSERSLGKLRSKLRSKLGPPELNPARQKLGGFEWEWSKKFILEVKTRKNTEWCENLSKSTTIWDQTVLFITQARNEIFQKPSCSQEPKVCSRF